MPNITCSQFLNVFQIDGRQSTIYHPGKALNKQNCPIFKNIPGPFRFLQSHNKIENWVLIRVAYPENRHSGRAGFRFRCRPHHCRHWAPEYSGTLQLSTLISFQAMSIIEYNENMVFESCFKEILFWSGENLLLVRIRDKTFPLTRQLEGGVS